MLHTFLKVNNSSIFDCKNVEKIQFCKIVRNTSMHFNLNSINWRNKYVINGSLQLFLNFLDIFCNGHLNWRIVMHCRYSIKTYQIQRLASLGIYWCNECHGLYFAVSRSVSSTTFSSKS